MDDYIGRIIFLQLNYKVKIRNKNREKCNRKKKERYQY